MPIPFTSLRFPRGADGRAWGLNATRSYPRTVRHQISAVPIDRNRNCFVCQNVKIAGFAFAPASLTVKAGTTVTWVNDDAPAHTVTADDGSFGSPNLAHGATFSQRFGTAGSYAYHCAIHPSMVGTVVVTP